MQRCPECWSTIETTGPDCPQCGARITAASRPRPWILASAAVGIAIAIGAVWWFSGPTDPAPTAEDVAATEATNDPTPPAPQTESTAREALHHWELSREVDEARVDALVVESKDPERALLFVPLSSIPRTGSMQRLDEPLDVDVVHADPIHGYALLIAARPEGIEPVQLASSAGVPVGSVLEPVTRHGERLEPVRLAARELDGTLIVDPELPRGSALLDNDGRAIGLMIDDLRALPVDQAMLWLDHRVGRPLAEVQAELRSGDPRWLLAEIDAVLNGEAPTVAELTKVLGLANRAASLARDRATIEAAHERTKVALRAKLRAEARNDDHTAAIATARGALALFPSHHGIAGDLVQLLSVHGDPFEAAGRFEQLRVASPQEAEAAGEVLADALLRESRRLARAGRTADARRALLRGLSLFPEHAGLRDAHARSQAGEVVIPIDSRSGSIDTMADVSGELVSFVVDTGATLTTIPTAVASRLGLRSASNPRITVQTANGPVQGERIVLPWVQVGTIRLARVDAVVIDLPGHLGNRGLLGMSALGQLDVSIAGGQMTLRPKSR